MAIFSHSITKTKRRSSARLPAWKHRPASALPRRILMGEAARMPELVRNAIKGDLVLELLPPVLRNEATDAIYPPESPLSSDQDRSRSILRSFSRHLPSCDSFERRLGGARAGLAGSANRPSQSLVHGFAGGSCLW